MMTGLVTHAEFVTYQSKEGNIVFLLNTIDSNEVSGQFANTHL